MHKLMNANDFWSFNLLINMSNIGSIVFLAIPLLSIKMDKPIVIIAKTRPEGLRSHNKGRNLAGNQLQKIAKTCLVYPHALASA